MVMTVLNKVKDPRLLKKMYPNESDESIAKMIEHLLDLYLNLPTKGNYDTPLHHAAKWGCLDIVELLVGFHSCNTTALNKAGNTPAEVACTRIVGNDTHIKEKIEETLEGCPRPRMDVWPELSIPWTSLEELNIQHIRIYSTMFNGVKLHLRQDFSCISCCK